MGSYTATWTDTVEGDFSRNSFSSTLTVSNATASGETFSVPVKLTVKKTAGQTGSLCRTKFSFAYFDDKQFPIEVDHTRANMVLGTSYTVIDRNFGGIPTEVYFSSSNRTSRSVSVPIKRYLIKSDTSYNGNVYGHYTNNNAVNATTFTVTLNAPPTFDSTQVTFNTPYVYAGHTTASVNVSNISVKYGGTVSSVAFTIGNQTVTGTGNGTLSILLNAGGVFTPTVKVTDSRGQVTTKTLNSITVNPYVAPSVAFSVERTDSSGQPNDEGTSAVISASFSWTNDIVTLAQPTVVVTDPNGLSVTVTKSWYKDRALTTAISDWSAITSSDMPLYCLLSGSNPFNTQYSYQISITPNDSEGLGTPITQTLGSAFYTVDFLAGGHGIAFGQACSDEGFFCNMDAHFLNEFFAKSMLGFIQMFAGQTAPTGWLMCDGTAVSRTDYADLYSVIGDTYGAGDGSTTFNLPDLRNRFPVGAGSTYNLNAQGGNKDAIVPSHKHTFTGNALGNHDHSFTGNALGTHHHGTGGAADYDHFVVTDSGASIGRRSIKPGTSTAVTNNVYSDKIIGHRASTQAVSAGTPSGTVGGKSAGTPSGTISTEGTSVTNANLPPYIGINFIIYAGA